jgi:hypothetical protein
VVYSNITPNTGNLLRKQMRRTLVASETKKARVFLSCGQQKGTEEVPIAQRIKTKLERMGFQPYIAVGEQTLKGVKDNIFSRLVESEYLIFIDFKREELMEITEKGEPKTIWHRGGLFSLDRISLDKISSIRWTC